MACGQPLAVHTGPLVIEHGPPTERQQVLLTLPVHVVHQQLPLVCNLLQDKGLRVGHQRIMAGTGLVVLLEPGQGAVVVVRDHLWLWQIG